MPAWKSSSLAFSDTSLPRHKTGLLKNLKVRMSKQSMTEKKMFGNKFSKFGKHLSIGRKFRGTGKGIMKAPKMKSSSISPNVDEFDSVLKGGFSGNNNRKKSLFSRKSFG